MGWGIYKWAQNPFKDNINTNMNIEKIVMFLFSKTITKIFSRIIMLAYEKGRINSKQMHEICAIWANKYLK